jgi:hypothetical protein
MSSFYAIKLDIWARFLASWIGKRRLISLPNLSLHFHSLKGRFGWGVPEVADFNAPG